MSSNNLISLELDASQALQALRDNSSLLFPRHFSLPFPSPQEDRPPSDESAGDGVQSDLIPPLTLWTAINAEMAHHQTQDDHPEFKLLDTHEQHCFNHIWHPLESRLHVEPNFKTATSVVPIIVIESQIAAQDVFLYAQRQNWATMVQRIQEYHDLLLPISSHTWRLPADVRHRYAESGLTPPTLEYVVWTIIALYKQLAEVASRRPDSLTNWAHCASIRMQYLVAHLLRRPSLDGRPTMMLPYQFFSSNIMRGSQVMHSVLLPLRPNEAPSQPLNAVGHPTPSFSQNPKLDLSLSSSPAEQPRNTKSSTSSSSHSLPGAADNIGQNYPEHLPQKLSGNPPLSTNAGAQDAGRAAPYSAPISKTKRVRTPAALENGEEQAAPTEPTPKRQKGEGVSDRTGKELGRAKEWENAERGMLAPSPCFRCRALSLRTPHQCWMPKQEYQAKHGMTCSYCRSQKTKCSLNPKYKDEGRDFFFKRGAKNNNSTEMAPMFNGGGGQSSGQSDQPGVMNQQSAHTLDIGEDEPMADDNPDEWTDVGEDPGADAMEWEK